MRFRPDCGGCSIAHFCRLLVGASHEGVLCYGKCCAYERAIYRRALPTAQEEDRQFEATPQQQASPLELLRQAMLRPREGGGAAGGAAGVAGGEGAPGANGLWRDGGAPQCL